MASASASSDGEAAFAALADLARRDDDILALWLGGSRGMGRATAHSDFDCAMVVRDEARGAFAARYGRPGQGPLDCAVFGLAEFEAYAAWGSPEAWDRYSFVGVTALVDKTAGRVQALIDAKGCVPADEIPAFVTARLDHFINQVYRSAKCWRDGLTLAARLEAAEGVSPLLDVVFALHGGRLRPYPKYLAWELETWPLERLPWPTDALLALIGEVLAEGSVGAQQRLLFDLEPSLRRERYGDILDDWGDALGWLRTLTSVASS